MKSICILEHLLTEPEQQQRTGIYMGNKTVHPTRSGLKVTQVIQIEY